MGISQGTVFEPPSFNLYINNLTNLNIIGKIFSYAAKTQTKDNHLKWKEQRLNYRIILEN